MENNKDKLLVVDGDILNFTIGRITEDISDFDGQTCESFDEEEMIRFLEVELDKISEDTGYPREDIIYSISDDKNFRKRLFPTYKSNRKNVRKPLGLERLREYLKENHEKYNLFMLEELEADDCMGIAATAQNNVAIYSQDKDLRTIPCKQWDFKRKKFVEPTVLEANRWLYTQVLTGDAVDGYKGCPRIGKIKAKKALDQCQNERELLEQTFVRFYMAYKRDLDLAKEKFLEQMGQARILHQLDYMQLNLSDTTYNPIEILNVSDEILNEWCSNYIESIAKEKKCKKKTSSVKNVEKSVEA
jgi:DNA polymerase-1